MKLVSRTLLVVLASVLGSTAAFTDAETRSVETVRVVSATPSQALDAFLDEGALAAWWNVSRSLVEKKNGGIWSVTWDEWGEGKTQHAWIGVIEELTPGRLLVSRLVMMEPEMPLLGPMQLEINVEPVDGGTSVTVSHRGYRYGEHWDEIYELVVHGWDHVLGDLDTWLQQDY